MAVQALIIFVRCFESKKASEKLQDRCVYFLCYPRATEKWPMKTPFYVGKGHLKRKFEHFKQARGPRNSHKLSVIRMIEKSENKVYTEVLHENLSDHEASLLEIFYIAKYGRADLGLGPLTNLTHGGDGVRGLILSEEQRYNNKAMFEDPEFRMKHSAAVSAAMNLPEIAAKQKAGLKLAWTRPEVRARRTAAFKLALSTPEALEKLSEAIKKAMIKPGVAEKQGAGIKKSWERSESRAKRVAGFKASWADPESRARRLSAMSRPEVKAKKSASLKAAHARRRARLAEEKKK